MYNEKGQAAIGTIAVFLVVLMVAGVIAFFMYILPTYNVWAAGKAGQAELQQADYTRQTKVVEARANLEAQKYNAEAEVARAQGVAQSNNKDGYKSFSPAAAFEEGYELIK